MIVYINLQQNWQNERTLRR